MAANTIRRIHKPAPGHVAPDVVLRFAGGLEVHPADCPRGIQAYPHWQPGPNGRAVCKCTTAVPA